VKFKDADLIGVPLRVTVGAKGLATGNVELKRRDDPDPKRVELLPVGRGAAANENVRQAAGVLVERVRAALGA
jgi:prolyl-tRNA synthetase